MTERRIGIDLEGPSDLAAYSTLVSGLHSLLSELSRGVSGKSVSWKIDDPEVTVSASPNGASEDAIQTIVQTAREGFDQFAEADGKRVAWPEHFTPAARKAVERIVRLLDRVPSLTVETDDAEPLTISHALLPVGQRARGAPEVSSVDGVLDVISVRGQMVVTVTEHVTGRRIRCLIGGDMLERAKAALGRRVVVEGTVAFTAAGAPRLVSEVSEIFVRPEPDGSIVELLGSLPDFSGGLSSGEYVRRMREGEDDET